jgi:antitoxin (DNA-binding transcriptional repressor) of toxin-antitoxin stability system
MKSVGLRELRHDTPDLVRREEDGEEIEITLAVRLAARLVPAASRRWRRWEDVADLFGGRPDPDWDRDRDLIDQSVTDPREDSDATGRQPRSRVLDLLIAATAHAHDARLYTRNVDDLRGVEQLVDLVAV